jgi:hypothetical protein
VSDEGKKPTYAVRQPRVRFTPAVSTGRRNTGPVGNR